MDVAAGTERDGRSYVTNEVVADVMGDNLSDGRREARRRRRGAVEEVRRWGIAVEGGGGEKVEHCLINIFSVTLFGHPEHVPFVCTPPRLLLTVPQNASSS